jgi:hypothetical protein
MMKKPHPISNRVVVAITMLLATFGYGAMVMAAQSGSAGLPPLPFTAPIAESIFANLTGCGTSGNFFQPATGTCTTPSGAGTVTSFSAGNLGPLFTTNVATATSTPALSFTASTAAQNSVLAGPASGGAGAYSFQTAPTFSAANLTNFPTFNQSTTGNAATASVATLAASSETVTFSTTPTFSTATRYSTITMTAAITSFTLASGAAGQEKTLTFCGPFTVAGPANVRGLMVVSNSAAGKCSSQHFNWDVVQTDWLADGVGIANM